MEVLRKRMKTSEESEEGIAAGVEDVAEVEMMATAGSDDMIQLCLEEMESDIQRILENIDRFTQQVSEMLETEKQLLTDLDDIKLPRMIDSANKACRALLQNAQLHLLQNICEN